MKVTGYMIREALTRNELRRTTLAQEFLQHQKAFAEEKGSKDPVAVMEKYDRCEQTIALLQAGQAEYNTKVSVTIRTIGTISLAAAVKLIGGFARIEAMWRDALKGSGVTRRYYEEDPSTTRSKEKEYATPVLTSEAVSSYAISAASRTSLVRAAIAEANAREVEVSSLLPVHFE